MDGTRGGSSTGSRRVTYGVAEGVSERVEGVKRIGVACGITGTACCGSQEWVAEEFPVADG